MKWKGTKPMMQWRAMPGQEGSGTGWLHCQYIFCHRGEMDHERGEGEGRPVPPPRRANRPLLRSQSRAEEIRLACLKGDLTLLENLLKGDNGENLVNKPFEDGWTPLSVAANAANPTILKFLLGQGADPNLTRPDGFSPLMAALMSTRGKVLVQQCAQLLVDAGANVSARSQDGLTPIHLAVKDNSIPMVAMLIYSGADITAKDSKGRTAAEIATAKNLDKVLVALKTHEEKLQLKENSLPGVSSNLVNSNPENAGEKELEHVPVNPQGPLSQPQPKLISENEASPKNVQKAAKFPQPSQISAIPTFKITSEDIEEQEEPTHFEEPDNYQPILSNAPSIPKTNGQSSTPRSEPTKAQRQNAESKKESLALWKVGVIFGVVATLMGGYYSKFYFQSR